MKISLDEAADRIGTPVQWRQEHQRGSRPIIWNDAYGAPEASLVLDPTTMGAKDLSPTDRRVLLGFSMAVHGSYGSSVVAGPYARDYWGIPPERFGLKPADKKAIKAALYGMSTELGYLLKTEDKARGVRKMALAPTRSLYGETFATDRLRNTFNLQASGIGSCPVARSVLTGKHLRDLDTEPFELLLILYGLNDLQHYGGVDPTHAHVGGGELLVSDSLLRSWRFGAVGLVEALAELYGAELIAFVPSRVELRRWFPCADPHVSYLGDSDASDCETFTIRPVHQIERFAGAWAA